MNDKSVWRWVSHEFVSDGDNCELCGVNASRAIHSRGSAERRGECFIEGTRDEMASVRSVLTEDELERVEEELNRFKTPIPEFAEAVRFAREKGRIA